ncbi:MAG TPA: hypothetical protein VH370_27300, partial [Humisphaera sp.]|nr:hypothetical protein [Humisphaera sp.]
IHSTNQIVATPQAKAELYSRTNALAVEMEAYVVRPWAAKSGANFVSIRAISDAASESLDPSLLRIVDDLGRARFLMLALELLRRPSLIPRLVRLANNSQKAARELGNAVGWMVSRAEAENGGLSHT